MKWRECAMLALPWGLVLAGPPLPPAAPAPAPASSAADTELLEFLGSVDSAEPGWHDYLEHTDIEKVIHAPPRPALPPNQGKRT